MQLVDRDFKTAMVNMLMDVKESRNIERKEKEDIKSKKMTFLKLKSIISEIKKFTEWG